MSKLIAVLLSALVFLLLFSFPALAKDHEDEEEDTRSMEMRANVVAVARTTTAFDPTTGLVSGTATYAGIITSAFREDEEWDRLIGRPIVAQESFTYWVDASANIVYGHVTGVLTVDGGKNSTATVAFEADVTGNIATGPACDAGSWQVTSATNKLEKMEDASGAWTACMVPVDIGGGVYTFAGEAVFTGTY
ncbi:MAG: hypothetical protein HY681_03800 [Chloroflexi bacterium]|nr:hypothetical protein [Chloroflexota bacterium]